MPQELTEEQRHVLYQQVFNTPPGKQVLAELYERARIESGYFVAEPMLHAFNAGRADIVLHILRQLNTTPKE
jgi:hypothetical protein